MVDDAGPQSLFVVVSYKWDATFFSSILHLETKVPSSSRGEHTEIKRSSLEVEEAQVIKYEYVARFEHPRGYTPIRWVISHLAYDPEDLCMMPDWGPRNYQKRAPLHGCIFNLRNKECTSIKPPWGSLYYRHVVALGDHFYFMGASPNNYKGGALFARCNRLNFSWEALTPFPYNRVYNEGEGLTGIILATAFWNNTILLTMKDCGMWLYDVDTNKWYPVVDNGRLRDKIVRKAVVVSNTIYALTREDKVKDEIVMAISIEREESNDGGLKFICSLCSEILVPGLDEVQYDLRLTRWRTMDLVHLGGDNFCIVRSCNSHLYEDTGYQPIQVTTIKLKEKNMMTVTDICVYAIQLLENELFGVEQFNVELCFSLPEYKTAAFKQGNRFFAFDPFPEDFAPRSFFRYPSLNAHFISKPLKDNDSSQVNITAELNVTR